MRAVSPVAAVLLLLVSRSGASAQDLTERFSLGGYHRQVLRAELSPDGKLLAVASAGAKPAAVTLYGVSTGKKVASFTTTEGRYPFALAFSADGRRLAAGSSGGLQVWDVQALEEVASLASLASFVALNWDGTRVAGVDSEVKLWDVATGKQLASFPYHVSFFGGERGAAFTRDLATFAVRNYQDIDLWDTAKGKEKATLSEHRGEVGCMIWSADEKTLIASSSCHRGRDCKYKGDVKLWDVAARKERATLPGPFGCVRAMSLSPDGKSLALLDWTEITAPLDLKLVDLTTGRQRVLHTPRRCTFLSLRFTPAGKLLVVSLSGASLRLYEVAQPKAVTK